MSLQPLTPPLRFSTLAFSPVRDFDAQASQSPDLTPLQHSDHRETAYRGAYPKHRNLFFLSRLHLRSVLSLTPKPLENDSMVRTWASQGDLKRSNCESEPRQIHLFHVRCEKPKDESGGLTREGAARAISILLDRRNHPIYVHCLDGVEVTSTLVACIRKIQAWSPSAILSELGRALRDSSSSEWSEVPSHLSSFVTKFGQPDGLRLPPRNHIPSWLWPAPSPLSLLADPYAWAGSQNSHGSHHHHLLHNQSNGNQQVHPSSASISSSHRMTDRNDPTSQTPATLPQQTPTSRRNHQQLPIQHPSLKLHFDVDPNLPLPQAHSIRPVTPSRLSLHSRASSTSTSGAQTPPLTLSRPASRSGRTDAGASMSRSHSRARPSEEQDRLSVRASGPSLPRSSSTDRIQLSPPPRLKDGITEALAASFADQSPTTLFHPSLVSSHSRIPVPTFPEAQEGVASFFSAPANTGTNFRSQDPNAHDVHVQVPLLQEYDDMEVSTPKARPTTSGYNIGIAGTVFHESIPDDQVQSLDRSQTLKPVSVVSLDSRRRLLEDGDGEQTPTKAKSSVPQSSLFRSMGNYETRTGQAVPSDLAPTFSVTRHSPAMSDRSKPLTSAWFDEPESLHDRTRNPNTFAPSVVPQPGTEDEVLSRAAASKLDFEANADEKRKEMWNVSDDKHEDEEGADGQDDRAEKLEEEEEEDDDTERHAQGDEEEAEEGGDEEEDDEEEEEEEDEEEEDEDDREDENEDDLALQALDLEGY